jgi:hypothetical protein
MSKLVISIHEAKGGVLKVEKYDYGFRFYRPGSKVSYFVKTDPNNSRAFLVVEEENKEAKEVFGDLFANMGVKNICGLFIKLLLRPEETVYAITGNKLTVKRISLNDYSERAKDGFDECIFADFLTPEQLLNAQPEG